MGFGSAGKGTGRFAGDFFTGVFLAGTFLVGALPDAFLVARTVADVFAGAFLTDTRFAPARDADLPVTALTTAGALIAGAARRLGAESGRVTTTGGTTIARSAPPDTSPAATTEAPEDGSLAIAAAVATTAFVELSSGASLPPLNSPSMNGFAMQS